VALPQSLRDALLEMERAELVAESLEPIFRVVRAQQVLGVAPLQLRVTPFEIEQRLRTL
jgi:hypothetical protein